MSLWANAYNSAGLTDYTYIPPSVPVALGGWPTLESMIISGKRLVSFVSASSDYTQAPFMLDEFSESECLAKPVLLRDM